MLIADWAIGSQKPLVDQYLAKFFPSEDIAAEQPGIFDVVRDYRDVSRRDTGLDLGTLWEEHGRVGDHILTLGWPDAGLDTGLTGKLAYLGPGLRADQTYWTETESFNWPLFVESTPGRHSPRCEPNWRKAGTTTFCSTTSRVGSPWRSSASSSPTY